MLQGLFALKLPCEFGVSFSLCAGRQQWHDVRMLQYRCQLDLSSEPIDVDLGGEIGRKNFEHDLPLEIDPRERDRRVTFPRRVFVMLDRVQTLPLFLPNPRMMNG